MEDIVLRPLLLEVRCKCGGTFDIVEVVGGDIFVSHTPPECAELRSMSTRGFLKWVSGRSNGNG